MVDGYRALNNGQLLGVFSHIPLEGNPRSHARSHARNDSQQRPHIRVDDGIIWHGDFYAGHAFGLIGFFTLR